MKKDEAIKKVSEAYERLRGNGTNFVDALEALGLIKFDDPEISVNDAIVNARADSIYTDTASFIEKLERFGYKIVKK